jgi:hypothetical protein
VFEGLVILNGSESDAIMIKVIIDWPTWITNDMHTMNHIIYLTIENGEIYTVKSL